MLQYAISDCSGTKLTSGEAISEFSQQILEHFKEASEEISPNFVVPVVSLVPE